MRDREHHRRPGFRLIAAVLLCAGFAFASRGAGVEEAFDEANKLYEQGRFPEAAEAYQRLVESGQRTATVLFNLGNARFKAGQPGRALAAYRQAERLSPRDPGVAFNLSFLRKKISGAEDPAQPLWDRALQALTVNEWTLLTSAGLWSFLLLLALAELRETARPAFRRYALVTAAVTVLLGATTAAAHRRSHAREAVVVVAEAILRSGPLEEARVLFQLRDGAEVTIEDEKSVGAGDVGQTWCQIRDASGRAGWIKQDQIVRIR